MSFLSYDPGALPTAPSPNPGDTIEFSVDGWPPSKDRSASIRNTRHRYHGAFKNLRIAAQAAMDGRAWYAGPVQLDISIFCPDEERPHDLNEYMGGIMDTLDGSHGFSFTYLPIVYEDDCQVCSGATRFAISEKVYYTVRVTFSAQI